MTVCVLSVNSMGNKLPILHLVCARLPFLALDRPVRSDAVRRYRSEGVSPLRPEAVPASISQIDKGKPVPSIV